MKKPKMFRSENTGQEFRHPPLWVYLKELALPLCHLDDCDRILDCNEAFTNLCAASPDSLIGQPINWRLEMEGGPVQTSGNGLGSRLVHLTCSAGSRRQMVFHFFNLAGGGTAGLFLAPPPFETRIRLLDQRPELFRTLFFESSFGMATADKTGRLLHTNAALDRLLGCTPESDASMRLLELIHPERADELRQWFREAEGDGSAIYNGELPLLRRDGEVAWGRFTINRLSGGKKSRKIRFVALVQDITEHKISEQKIRRLAFQDPLTGIPNRSLLKDRMHQALAQLLRQGGHMGVLFLDLDRFKRINDTLGHAAGDRLLQEVALRLQGLIRQSDTVARLGGDEFVILVTGVKSSGALSAVAEKVIRALAPPIILSGREIHITTSIGIAFAPEDGRDIETLLHHADMAMYAAKDGGRNSFQFFCPRINLQAAERLELENDLRRALLEQEFFLLYHPQVDLDSGEITGVEALLRWNHPVRGVMCPGEFLPLAEETGIILEIGGWVLQTACKQAKDWQKCGFPMLRMAVNISAHQFRHPDFPASLSRMLHQSGFHPGSLELDLTESVLTENLAETNRTLFRLKKLGVRLAIDDFGTGRSSLNHLKDFPIDRLKIAREFVQDVANRENAALVDAIVAMGRSFGINLLAEGIETPEQLRYLRRLRCHEMQGFYFSLPVSPGDFSKYLENGIGKTCLLDAKAELPQTLPIA